MIKLTPSEQVHRSRLKKEMLAKDSTWTIPEIKLHLAEFPEVWIPKKNPITEIEYQRRLKLIKEQWCPWEILKWKKIIAKTELILKKKES